MKKRLLSVLLATLMLLGTFSGVVIFTAAAEYSTSVVGITALNGKVDVQTSTGFYKVFFDSIELATVGSDEVSASTSVLLQGISGSEYYYREPRYGETAYFQVILRTRVEGVQLDFSQINSSNCRIEIENYVAEYHSTVITEGNERAIVFFKISRIPDNPASISGRITEVDADTETTVELYEYGARYPMEICTVIGEGEYSFIYLPRGNYSIKVEADGYNPQAYSMLLEGDVTFDFELEKMWDGEVYFSNITPAVSARELAVGSKDLGTVNLGGDNSNIGFVFFAEELPSDAIKEGWEMKRELTVYCDGEEIHNAELAPNNASHWNLKNNITTGGRYNIEMRIYAENGDSVVEKIFTFNITVKGDTIKRVSVKGIVEPMIGMLPSETAECNTGGVYVSTVNWEYYDENATNPDWAWLVMPDGTTFEEGGSYRCTLTLRTEEGYSFPATAKEISATINGKTATVIANPYDAQRCYVSIAFDTVSEPKFTLQPKGATVIAGTSAEVTWELNFTPIRLELMTYIVGPGAQLNDLDNHAATSVRLNANSEGGYYRIRAYYSEDGFISSDKFVIQEQAEEEYLLGDMDKDESITVADALAALRIAAQLTSATEEDIKIGDVDGDGSITVADALAILRVAAQLAEGF